MGSYVQKKVEFLVVDTSAFIKKAAIQDIGEKILTVPQVVEEIKSKRQLRRLVVLPYDLLVKEAFPENIKFVSEFAKKTGDYASLSVTDINIIALTYQLEKEKNGISHLNSTPICRPTIHSTATIPEDLKKIAGFYVPKKVQSVKCKEDSNYNLAEDKHDESLKEGDLDDESVKENENNNEIQNKLIPENECQLKNIKEKNKKNVAEEDSSNDNEETWPEKENENKDECNKYNEDADPVDAAVAYDHDNDDDDGDDDDNNDDDDDDDDDDNNNNDDDDDSHWITPSNIEKVKIQITGELNDDFKNVNVACLTTDFSMQNVLKQIGLNVVSLDGKMIKQLRTFILRCYGCFKTTSIMTKVFCPNCGNKTLKKVAVSLDENRTPHLHINFRKPLTARGKKYSLPRFKGGKHSNNPVICEDQPMPQQRPSRLSRTKNDPMNDDYIAGYSPFVTRDVTSKSAILGIKPHLEIKHWTRKNPNDSRKKKK